MPPYCSTRPTARRAHRPAPTGEGPVSPRRRRVAPLGKPLVQALIRNDLLILEDLGMKKLDPCAAEDLFEVLSYLDF
jgi:hypothetical protein